MSRQIRHRKIISDINVVPYIDVTLVLLVVFMVTAPLQQSAVEVDLAVAKGAVIDKKQPSTVIISIQKNGHYFLSEKSGVEQQLAIPQLLLRISALQKANPQTQVYIKGDKAVDYGKVVSMMAALKEVGIARVGLVTTPPGH